MIVQVASPGHLTDRWRNVIQRAHADAFGYYVDNSISLCWWFADITSGIVRGIAGAKPEDNDRMFLGPCVVFRGFRGQGIQRDFIRRREQLATGMKYPTAVTCTDRQNYVSANNFIRSGYVMVPPWRRDIEGFICWSRPLPATMTIAS